MKMISQLNKLFSYHGYTIYIAIATQYSGVVSFRCHKSRGLRPRDLYTSSGIPKAIDPLASASNL